MLVSYDGSRYTAQDVLARIESQKTNVQLVESVLFCAAYKKTGGVKCIYKETRTGVALAGRHHFH